MGWLYQLFFLRIRRPKMSCMAHYIILLLRAQWPV